MVQKAVQEWQEFQHYSKSKAIGCTRGSKDVEGIGEDTARAGEDQDQFGL